MAQETQISIENTQVSEEGKDVGRTQVVYRKGDWNLDLVVELIMDDYYVRTIAQQEEALKERGRALRRMENTEDEAQLQELDEEQDAP
ncbi:unnamed protein product [Penicillium glandicola]